MCEAVKFDFKLQLKKLSIKLLDGWEPNSLQLSWKRGERRKFVVINCDGFSAQTDIDTDASLSMIVTLYKVEGVFQEKNYSLDLEDVNGLSVKKLATCTLNMCDCLDDDRSINVVMKSLSQKTSDVHLHFVASHVFLKSGHVRDLDMESNFSHVTDDLDASCENLQEVAMMQSRAILRQSKFLNDIDVVNSLTLSRFSNLPSLGVLPAGSPEGSGLGLTGQKEFIDSTRKTVSRLSFKDWEGKEIIRQVCDDDVVLRKSFKLKKIELENEALRVRNVHLMSMLGTYKHDMEMMQSEIDQLLRLVQELRIKLYEAEEVPKKQTTISKATTVTRPVNLKGWLCKRGVKGGPLGHRWKRRWFVQSHDRCLYYYKKQTSSEHQGFIELEKIIGVQDVMSHKQDKNNGSFNVMTESRIFNLMAHDEHDKLRWINSLDSMQESTRKYKSLHR